MNSPGWVAAVVFTLDLLVRVGLSIRVIMRRLPAGVSFAWLFVISAFPIAGAVAYLMFGELRLGRRHAARAAALHQPYQSWLAELRRSESAAATPSDSSFSRLIERTVGIPALDGNHLQLLPNWQDAFQSLIQEIDDAKRSCHLEFYIWHEGGMADQVTESLIRAAARGVACRVLVDSLGSRSFLTGKWPPRLRAVGVRVQEALSAGLLRIPFVRYDLRLHRKIVVIDGRVAFTGSLNLVDPRHFKQEAGVGEWVDAMVRLEGPAVEPLAITFLEDWALETGETIESLRKTGDVKPVGARGDSIVQVVPSGPAQVAMTMERILLTAIYQAQRELILTSPYFVPDQAIVQALLSAAQRGVDVTLIVPEKVDSRLVQWASGAFLGDLVSAGVRVLLFHGGLLHTKSVTVDGNLSLFGSLNLDPRSLHLNFEITLAVFDDCFAGELKHLQSSYAAQSRRMLLDDWGKRTATQRLMQNAAQLVGPLL